MVIPVYIGEMLKLATGEDTADVAKAVQAAVREVGSVAELARRCKVSPSTIFRLQKGNCRPCKRTFYQLYNSIGKFLPEDTWIGLAESERRRVIIRRSTIWSNTDRLPKGRLDGRRQEKRETV